MVGRLLRVTGTALVIAVALVMPVIVTATEAPAAADTVVSGCTIVSNPTPTNFTDCPGANLGGADLSGVNLSFANLAGAAFVDCGVISDFVCAAANLSGANLTNANLSNGSFFDAILYAPCGEPSCIGIASGAAFLPGADLSDADLSSAQLHQVDLTDAVLTNANLTSATFTGCVSSICRSGATLTGANLTGATLTKTDFSGTILVPSDRSVFGTATGAVVSWPAPQSLPGATPGTCTASSGSSFPLGTTTVTCQVLDDRGDVTTGTFTVDVSQVSTSTDLTSSVSGPVGVGARVTYTADVFSNPTPVQNPPPAPAGGTVAFTDNGTMIASCSAVPLVEGNPSEASCSVTFETAGSNVIQPIYGGSGIFQGNDGQSLTENVVSTTPPTTSVVLPSNGATITGGTWLDAGESSPVGVASVAYELNGGPTSNTVISKSSPTPYGWIGGWDSTSVPNGTYTLQSVATDVDGISSTSAPITINVNNPAASTSVIIPSTGATQSGTAAPLDATASANVTNVIYELSGGPSNLSAQVIATGTPTFYGWLAQWNTTTVPNGTYALQSVGSYSGGTVASAPITVTVDNPPTASVLIPSSGATLSGSTVLDASASNATSVEFRLFGGVYGYSGPVVCTAALTYYGWLCSWNTSAVPDGSYVLVSEAFGSGGSTFSSGIDITVKN